MPHLSPLIFYRALPRLWHFIVVLSILSPTMSFFSLKTQRIVSSLLRPLSNFRSFRATPTCGLQINIHIRGKRTGGEEFLNDAYLEYTKRLRPVLVLETIWHKSDAELEAAVAKEKAPVICLDERGKQLPSLVLADVLYKRLEEGMMRPWRTSIATSLLQFPRSNISTKPALPLCLCLRKSSFPLPGHSPNSFPTS